MSTRISPLAGQPATVAPRTDIAALLAAYDQLRPDPAEATQRVAFGTSGHRGTSLERSFNEWHVLAITQAICEHRATQKIDGPLFIGADTHALSAPAFRSALEVLAANGIETLVSANGEFTPTPALSRAILVHNRGRSTRLADGIVITPSHNPPSDGGFKYNPPNGGPADTTVTSAIEARANALLASGLQGVRRMGFEEARRADSTRDYDFVSGYVADLANVVDLAAIRASGIRLGVDPLGGAGVHYWRRIGERFGLQLEVVSEQVDSTFSFMTLDWDGRIRMDPSSSWAMQRLLAIRDRFDVAFGCDTDHDRHGIVTRSAGLMPTNHFLSVAADYLFSHRQRWSPQAAIGKTVVSSAMIDRVAARLNRRVYEVPVGFKWFVDGLIDGSLAFVGEESAGATLNRLDGSAWTTDKDGIVPCLLAAEITARTGRDPAENYLRLANEFGAPVSDRIDAPATPAQKKALARLSPQQIQSRELAGEPIEQVLDRAPGNGAAIGGIKVIAPSGWFAARPSGTENIYKIYAESFRGQAHLQALLQEAQSVVDRALSQST